MYIICFFLFLSSCKETNENTVSTGPPPDGVDFSKLTPVTTVTDTPFNHFKIHHAYSVDGETSWVQDSTHIIEKTDLTWHNDDLISPTALYDNKKVYLWYGGNQGGLDNLGIGLSICNL